METFLLLAVFLVWPTSHLCAPHPEEEVTQSERLKRLSKVGEEFVDEEVKTALAGMTQMKRIMERNVAKHEELMTSLRRSSEEKQEAWHLMQDIKERLGEAEGQCQSTLSSSWEGCQPCLDSSCLLLFATTCHQGISTFTSKVEEFFRGISSLSSIVQSRDGHDLWFDEDSNEDEKMKKIENWFGKLNTDIQAVFNKSTALYNSLQHGFDQPSYEYLMSDKGLLESQAMPLVIEDSVMDGGFLQDLDLPAFFQTLLSFSSDIYERLSAGWAKILDKLRAVAKDLLEQVREGSEGTFARIMSAQETAECQELGQNTSGCLQFQERCQQCQDLILKDCPEVPELLLKSDEASTLMNRSQEQYQQISHIVQHHAQDTSSLMHNMMERFGWVSELVNMATGSENIFQIVKVSFGHKDEDFAKEKETIVEVNVLSSPKLLVRVPPDLDIENPEFMQRVAKQALQLFRKYVGGHH
ncbi:clusterin-like protein 1 [Ambystoma mexicanum]|uniref:clusterin-like protein 1 n=1 Tax=Ambystoma mexicanum TaxID=8296 RepID=UPI0037E8D711